MFLKQIRLQDFRNIENEKIEFGPEVNVIYGENAQGKTNVLEAIYCFARGKSFRAFKDRETIRFGQSVAYAEILFDKRNETIEEGVEIPKNGNKKFYYNQNKVGKTADIIGEFRAVLFCPDHLSIIKDASSVRRNFLDIGISQLKPIYVKMLTQYKKVLDNRNAILKMNEKERIPYREMLKIYSDELASLCSEIYEVRKEYVCKLDRYVSPIFEEMTEEKEKVKITYESNIKEQTLSKEEISAQYQKLLSENWDKEFKNATTLYGIHRDDLKIELNGKDARFYSSQGQGRSLALALKLAEGEIAKEQTLEYPVFLLDDVLSELDQNRRNFILNNLKKRQVIITSCEPELFSEDYNAVFIKMENGKRVQ